MLQSVADKISNRYDGNTKEDVTNNMNILREKFSGLLIKLDRKLGIMKLIQEFHNIKNELMLNYEDISTCDVFVKEFHSIKYDFISDTLQQYQVSINYSVY